MKCLPATLWKIHCLDAGFSSCLMTPSMPSAKMACCGFIPIEPFGSIGARFVHRFHDVIHVELRRFLAWWKILERSHEASHDFLDSCHRKSAALYPPAVIIVGIGIRPLKWIAAQVEMAWGCAAAQRARTRRGRSWRVVRRKPVSTACDEQRPAGRHR